MFFYCVGFPIGIGMTYWTPIMCGWEWFPNNKGLVSGLIVAGFGFGAFFFGFISTAIINPNDEKADKLNGKFSQRVYLTMYHICSIFVWDYGQFAF